jgi:hypothetical protein
MSIEARSKTEFAHRRVQNETQSICMRCFLSVRAEAGETLKQAERQHLLTCPNIRKE